MRGRSLNGPAGRADMVIDWAFEGIEAVGRVLRKALDVNLSGCSVPPAAGPRPTCRIPLLDRAMQGNDGRSSTASPIASLSVRQRKGKCKGSNGCAADQTIEARLYGEPTVDEVLAEHIRHGARRIAGQSSRSIWRAAAMAGRSPGRAAAGVG